MLVCAPARSPLTMINQSLTVLALVAASVIAFPGVSVREAKASLPFVGRLNITGRRLPDIDRARAAQHLSASRKRQTSSIDVTNEAVTYVANVGVGTPPTTYSLLIDTGSSNTWVGASKPFVETSSTKLSGLLSEVTYGSGFFIGEEGESSNSSSKIGA